MGCAWSEPALAGGRRARLRRPRHLSGAFRGASPQLFAELAAARRRAVLDFRAPAAPALTALTAHGHAGHRRRRPGGAPRARRMHRRERACARSSRRRRTRRSTHRRRAARWHLATASVERMAVIAHDARQIVTLESRARRPRGAHPRRRSAASAGQREHRARDRRIVRLGLTPPDERAADLRSKALTSPFGGWTRSDCAARARLRHIELDRAASTPAARAAAEAMAIRICSTASHRRPERVRRASPRRSKLHTSGRRGRRSTSCCGGVGSGAPPSAASCRRHGGPAQMPAAPRSRAHSTPGALFDAAKRFVERSPQEKPPLFIATSSTARCPRTPVRPTGRAGHAPDARDRLGAEFGRSSSRRGAGRDLAEHAPARLDARDVAAGGCRPLRTRHQTVPAVC